MENSINKINTLISDPRLSENLPSVEGKQVFILKIDGKLNKEQIVTELKNSGYRLLNGVEEVAFKKSGFYIEQSKINPIIDCGSGQTFYEGHEKEVVNVEEGVRLQFFYENSLSTRTDGNLGSYTRFVVVKC